MLFNKINKLFIRNDVCEKVPSFPFSPGTLSLLIVRYHEFLSCSMIHMYALVCMYLLLLNETYMYHSILL